MEVGNFIRMVEMGVCKERATRTRLARRVQAASSSTTNWFATVTSVIPSFKALCITYISVWHL